jgi:hypothetical protein
MFTLKKRGGIAIFKKETGNIVHTHLPPLVQGGEDIYNETIFLFIHIIFHLTERQLEHR